MINEDYNSKLDLAFNPTDERLDKLYQNERFYLTDQTIEVWAKMRSLMNQNTNKTKVRGILLTGKPHAGKSTLVKQFMHYYFSKVNNAKRNDILYFEIPIRTRLKGTIQNLCKALKIPDIPDKNSVLKNYNTAYFIEKAAAKIRRSKIKLLILDEFQNLFKIPAESRVEILEGFNSLLNKAKITMVIVGVEGIENILDVVQSDHTDESDIRGTFSSRFPETNLARLEDGEEFISILIRIIEDCYLDLNPDIEPFFMDEGIREYILDITDGILGKVIMLLKETAWNIFYNQWEEIITLDLLKMTAKQLKSSGWSNTK